MDGPGFAKGRGNGFGQFGLDQGNHVAAAPAAAELGAQSSGGQGGRDQAIQFGGGDAQLVQEGVVGGHQGAEVEGVALLDDAASLLGDGADVVEDRLVGGRVGLSAGAQVADDGAGEAGQAAVADDQGEGLGHAQKSRKAARERSTPGGCGR